MTVSTFDGESYTWSAGYRTPSFQGTSNTIDVWGLQFEVGSLSSYIKTTSSAVTREADVCSVTTPSGVTQIVETVSDDTTNTITSIPTTYTVSSGKVKKVIMT